ncbi:hypothetical protein [Klebsiella pneumoniae]|nr:hypothetical protein [Klebsiella pneumoniae]
MINLLALPITALVYICSPALPPVQIYFFKLALNITPVVYF